MELLILKHNTVRRFEINEKFFKKAARTRSDMVR